MDSRFEGSTVAPRAGAWIETLGYELEIAILGELLKKREATLKSAD